MLTKFAICCLLITLVLVPGAGKAQIINSFPACENFDGFNNCGFNANACVTDQSCANVFGFSGWINASGDDIDWSVNSGPTPSVITGPTGPAQDHTSGSGKYLFTESSSCYNMQAVLLSPLYDLSSLTQPQLKYWYHMYGTNMGTLSVEAEVPAGSGTWIALDAISGNQGNSWQARNIDLSSITEDTVRFRFNGFTGTSFRSDIAIDDVCVKDGIDPFCEYFSTPISALWENNGWFQHPGSSSCASTTFTGDYAFFRYNYSNSGEGTLTTPAVNISGMTNPMVSFHLYRPESDGILNVDVFDDVNWISNYYIFSDSTAAWHVHSINLGDLPNPGPVILRFSAHAGKGCIIVDDVCFEEAPCILPKDITTSQPGSSSISIWWTSANIGTNYDFEYGIGGFVQGDGIKRRALITSATPQVQVSNLIPGIPYEFYLKEECAVSALGPFPFQVIPSVTSGNCLSTGVAIPDDRYPRTTEIRVTVNNVSGNRMGDDVVLSDGNLIINHPDGRDLNVFLQSPSGVEVPLALGNVRTFGNPSDCPVAVTNFSMDAPKAGYSWSFKPKGDFNDFNDGSNPNGTWLLKICDSSLNLTGAVQFVELVFDDPPCAEAKGVQVTNVTSSAATILWNKGDRDSLYVLEYGIAGYAYGTGTQIVVTGDTFRTINGLTSGTYYDLHIFAICESGDTSEITGPVNFSTSCPSRSLPYYENFEGILPPNLPCNWTFVDNNSSAVEWATTPITFNSSKRSLKNVSQMDNGAWVQTSDRAITPWITANGTKSALLSFSFASANSDSSVRIQVYRDQGILNLNKIYEDTVEGGEVGFLQIPFSISTSFPLFRIRVLAHAGNGSILLLDDLRIVENESICKRPYNLHSTSANDTVFRLSWSSFISGTSFSVEYGPAGFSPGGGTLITGITDTSRLLSGLQRGTTYEYYVSRTCGTGNSAWSGPGIFGTPCGNTCDYTLTLGSKPDVEASGSTPLWNSSVLVTQNNFSLHEFKPDLVGFDPADTFQLEICEGSNTELFWNSTEPLHGYEFLQLRDADNNIIYQFIGGAPDEGFFYSFNGKCPDCVVPFNVRVTPYYTTAKVQWKYSGEAQSYSFEYGISGFLPGTGTLISITDTSLFLSGLDSTTAYDIYIQKTCANQISSEKVGPMRFSTLCDPGTSLPFSEDFETNSPPQLPCGWSAENSNQDVFEWNTVYTSVDSNFSAVFDKAFGQGSADDWLFSPPFFLKPDKTYMLQFELKANSGGSPIIVNLGTGPSSERTIVVIDTISYLEEPGFNLLSCFFSPPDSGFFFIGFHQKGSSDGLSLDNISLDLFPNDPQCETVITTWTENVTATTAEVRWEPVVAQSAYMVEWDTVGFTPGSGSNSGSPQLSGLTPGTDYDFYIYQACQSGATSFPSPVQSFTTAPSNISCSNAVAISCGDTLLGTTFGAEASEREAWYKFTGTGTKIRLNVTKPFVNLDNFVDVRKGNCPNPPRISVNINSPIPTTSGTQYYVVVEDDYPTKEVYFSISLCIDTPFCTSPPNITNVTYQNAGKRAIVSWTSGRTGHNYKIITTPLSSAQPIPNISGTVNSTSTTKAINGIIQGIPYKIVVSEECVPCGCTWVSDSIVITSPCATIYAPYCQDFSYFNSIPNCWTDSSSTSENWTAFAGDGYAKFSNQPGITSTVAYLYSPLISLMNSDSLLSFRMSSQNLVHSTFVRFSIDLWNGTAWITDIFSYSGDNGGWTYYFIDMRQHAISGPVQLRFKVNESGSAAGNHILLDDVCIGDMGAVSAVVTYDRPLGDCTGQAVRFTGPDVAKCANNEPVTAWYWDFSPIGPVIGPSSSPSARTPTVIFNGPDSVYYPKCTVYYNGGQCIADIDPVTIFSSPEISLISAVPENCIPGTGNASIEIHVAPDNQTYDYLWSPGGYTGQNLFGISDLMTYSLTLRKDEA